MEGGVMSSIKEIVYRVWRKVDGGNLGDDSRFTYRELKGYVVAGIAQAMRDSYFAQRNLEDFKYGDDSIAYSYLATVSTDATKGLQYVTVTGKSISIAGNRFLDINSVNPASGVATMYIPLRTEEVFINKLQTSLPCINYFYKENNKAYFIGKKVTEAQVLVTEKYSIPADDDADLTLPSEVENMAFEAAYRLLVPLLPADRANDGVHL
jgi:hypothetical protein